MLHSPAEYRRRYGDEDSLVAFTDALIKNAAADFVLDMPDFLVRNKNTP